MVETEKPAEPNSGENGDSKKFPTSETLIVASTMEDLELTSTSAETVPTTTLTVETTTVQNETVAAMNISGNSSTVEQLSNITSGGLSGTLDGGTATMTSLQPGAAGEAPQAAEPIRTKRDAPKLRKAKDAEQCEYECKVAVKQPLVCHSCEDEKRCGLAQDLYSLDGYFELCKPHEACWTVYQTPVEPQVPDFSGRLLNTTGKFGFFRGCLGRSGNEFRLHCHQHSMEFCFGDNRRSVCAICCEHHGCNSAPLTFVSQTRNEGSTPERDSLLLSNVSLLFSLWAFLSGILST